MAKGKSQYSLGLVEYITEKGFDSIRFIEIGKV